MMHLLECFLLISAHFCFSEQIDYDLPKRHVKALFFSHPSLREACLQADKECIHYDIASSSTSALCWGHEEHCQNVPRKFICTSSKDDEMIRQNYWEKVDFGYVNMLAHNLYDRPVCKGETTELFCSQNLRLCHSTGGNVRIHFGKTDLRHSKQQYRTNLISEPGVLVGECTFDQDLFDSKLSKSHPLMGFLSSWKPEMSFFTGQQPLQGSCDTRFNIPVYIVKLDATINMYHHFCDFVNLYATLFAVNSDFSTDVQILVWETSTRSHFDPFFLTWTAFSKHQPKFISEFSEQTVCFDSDVIFVAPGRLPGGLYYNMPTPPGKCHGSLLFKSFRQFILHRMRIADNGEFDAPHDKIRVTFLDRGVESTRYVVNQDALRDAANELEGVEARIAKFNPGDHSFEDQLKMIGITDVLVGMHGAGLTHSLFLPDWAVLIELYPCGDPDCYANLARWRGLKYLTWDVESYPDKIHPNVSDPRANPKPQYGVEGWKFTNYQFEPQTFVSDLLQKALLHIRKHPKFLHQHSSFQHHSNRANTDADGVKPEL